jgi:hypothetical protein
VARDITHLGSDLTRRVDRIERGIQQSIQRTVVKAAEAGADEQRQVLRRDSGGDLRLSGVNRAKGRPGNTKIDAKFRLTDRGTTKVSAEIYAQGPVQIIAHDTSGHVIRSAYSNTQTTARRRGSLRGFVGPLAPGQTTGGRRAVLNIPGIGFRRSARHPGTRGKDSWNDGRRTAKVAINRVVGRETDRAFRQAAT